MTARNATDHGMPNQIAQSGVLPTADGKVMEYGVESPTLGRKVQFDNFGIRGDPPVQVYQEYKGDYSWMTKPYMPGDTVEKTMAGWAKEAQGQVAAVKDAGAPGAKLEWFLSTPDLEGEFVTALQDAGVSLEDIDIYTVPLRS